MTFVALFSFIFRSFCPVFFPFPFIFPSFPFFSLLFPPFFLHSINNLDTGAAASCAKCPAGFSSLTGASACTPCPPGQYNPTEGGLCLDVPDGFFTDSANSTEYIACGAGTTSNEDHTGCINDCTYTPVCTLLACDWWK